MTKGAAELGVLFKQLKSFIFSLVLWVRLFTKVTQSHILTRYHKCILPLHKFCKTNERAESLINVKGRGVSGGKDGLLQMRAFTIKWGDTIWGGGSLVRTNYVADYGIQGNVALYSTRPEPRYVIFYNGYIASYRSEWKVNNRLPVCVVLSSSS
jgi:hypothetical protein